MLHVGDNAFFNVFLRFRLRRHEPQEIPLLVIPGVVKGRHIVSLLLGQLLQQPLLAAGLALLLPGDNRIGRQLRRLFRFAEEKDVNIIGQRLGIVGTGAAGGDEGHILSPVLGKKGNAGQIQHIQDIGKAHFILKGEADHIEIGDRRLRLQGKEGIALLAHDLFHVGPRRVDALGRHVVPLVEQGVKNTQA